MDQPGVEIEPQAKRGRRRGRPRSGALAWMRRVMILLLVIGIAPALISLAYIPSAVHPVSTLMVKDVLGGRGYTREWLALDEIDPRLVNAVMMSEDGQFCTHPGIDLGEMRAIVTDFLDGEATRGGSTITMQTVKNLYLWHGRSYLRKAIEIPYAVYLDLVMPKRRIMEIYLNIAEWGPGIYGAEAAAQHHFGKSARKLTAREAALLAVTLPAPSVRTPGKPSAQLNRLAARIERRASHAGGYNLCLR